MSESAKSSRLPSEGGPARGVRWDLSDLYAGPDDPAIDADLDRGLHAARAFAAGYRGGVADLDAPALARAVDELEALGEPVRRAQAYASLLFAADTSAPRHGALLQHVRERSSEIRNTLVFFELEWAAVDDGRAGALLGDPRLSRRRHFLTTLRRYRPHLLSEPEERILEATANTGPRALTRLFDQTLGAMRFRVQENGRSVELGEEEALARLYSPSRATRREAARGLSEGLRESAPLLGFLLNTLVRDKATRDELRRYADPMDERHLANEIDGETVEALMTACERRFSLVERYYRLKARLLELDRLEDYDRYAPVSVGEETRSFDEAGRMVLDAYQAFSPEMATIVKRFFERRWIDAELRPGKRGGAFCASTLPRLHPYALVNYTGTLRDVMTLAHELGHGVHQSLARERGLFEQDSPLTTAETASVFGEMLVFRRLMSEERDPEARLGLVCAKLEDAFATVFRQVVMTRFEQRLHAARAHEGELPVERVNDLWLESNRPMFRDAVRLSDDYAWWWLYIPHFVHTPFYCYAYAFGELLVLALLHRYDEEGGAFVPRYLELLRAGGSVAPRELVAPMGLDVGDPAFWDRGLALLEGLVREAEALASTRAA